MSILSKSLTKPVKAKVSILTADFSLFKKPLKSIASLNAVLSPPSSPNEFFLISFKNNTPLFLSPIIFINSWIAGAREDAAIDFKASSSFWSWNINFCICWYEYSVSAVIPPIFIKLSNSSTLDTKNCPASFSPRSIVASIIPISLSYGL